MAESADDLSPAHSEDGLSFQDAADGGSPASSALNTATEITEVDQKEEEGSTSGYGGGADPPFSPSIATEATGSPSSAKGAKGKATGVAALLAKFQNSGADATTSASGAGPKSRSGSPSAPRRLVKPSGLDASPAKAPISSLESVSGVAVETEAEETVSASEGALSLLEPGETIKNPFGGETTPVTEALSQFQQISASQSGDVDVERHTAASPKEEAEVSPETPTTSQANRFSVISLNTPTQSTDTSTEALSREPIPASPPSSTTTQAEFLARQTARLSKAEGDKRSSIDGTEKIKERVRELRYGHSREPSGSRRSDEVDGAAAAIVPDAVHEEAKGEEKTYEVKLDGGEAIDWDFWGNVMSNYQEIAQTQPRQLSQAIQAGIPGALRGMMWQLMSSSKDEEMEIIYAYYLKQTSPHEKMIRKDLARTFPGQEYFRDGKGIGQENLFNVVKAYSLYDEECGYCQGMQFVVGPLLLNMPDEEAFSTLVRLMKSYDLRGHFVPNMPALQLRLFQFDRLLEETLPLLHRHLVRIGVKSSMYASGWFMTLFSYRSPLDICFRILDSVFAEGIEALFRFAMALMKKNEEDLLKLSFEEAVPLLAARVFDIYKSDFGDEGHANTQSQDENSGGAVVSGGYRVNEFIRDAFNFKITAFLLDSYASDFAEQVRVATSHRREVQELKLQNRNLQAKVKDLEDQLGAVQREHVDLVKNVVMAKLAKEEMAEELVKYKLMYAESTLMADISGVNRGSQSQLSASSSTQSNLRNS